MLLSRPLTSRNPNDRCGFTGSWPASASWICVRMKSRSERLKSATTYLVTNSRGRRPRWPKCLHVAQCEQTYLGPSRPPHWSDENSDLSLKTRPKDPTMALGGHVGASEICLFCPVYQHSQICRC